MNTKPSLPHRPPSVRNRWTRNNGASSRSRHSQNAQKAYERYLALAHAETQIGNTVGAENYYQHAEHYFRSMRPTRRELERSYSNDNK